MTQNFILKLKAHILPRIAVIHQEGTSVALSEVDDALRLSQLNHVLFNSNKIYRHRLLRINYTTYDIRREFDTINPHTDHRDIMLLSELEGSGHPFSYARVLGIFHANIIYTGPGTMDYRSRRIDFLWVRWFEVLQDRTMAIGWEQQILDAVRFMPMADEHAFGFVDPADVLRGCHIIPSFANGRLHPDGVAMSRCAGDAADWKRYYINRWVLVLITKLNSLNTP